MILNLQGSAVIHESYYWKQPLLESVIKFKECEALEEINEEVYVKIEQAVFIGFYSIRKLLETETKITSSLKNQKYDLDWFSHVGDNVTLRNNYKIDELYNLSKPQLEKRDLWFIASRVIHSFIFNPYINQSGGFDGIIFTSDIDKNKKLYMLSLDQLIKIFEAVGNDCVVKVEYKKCSETGKEFT